MWKQVTDEAGATEVSSGGVRLTGEDTATPSFTTASTAEPPLLPPDRDRKGRSSATDTDTVIINVVAEQVTAPSVTGVQILPETNDGSWRESETVEARLTFDEAVTVDSAGGVPSVSLTLGTSTQESATYLRGSGTAELTFGYTLAKGEGPYDSALLGAEQPHAQRGEHPQHRERRGRSARAQRLRGDRRPRTAQRRAYRAVLRAARAP